MGTVTPAAVPHPAVILPDTKRALDVLHAPSAHEVNHNVCLSLALSYLLPQARCERAASDKQDGTVRLKVILSEEAPHPVSGESWQGFLARLFSWVLQHPVTIEDVHNCFRASSGAAELQRLGLFPYSWPLPLRSSTVRAANSNPGRPPPGCHLLGPLCSVDVIFKEEASQEMVELAVQAGPTTWHEQSMTALDMLSSPSPQAKVKHLISIFCVLVPGAQRVVKQVCTPSGAGDAHLRKCLDCVLGQHAPRPQWDGQKCMEAGWQQYLSTLLTWVLSQTVTPKQCDEFIMWVQGKGWHVNDAAAKQVGFSRAELSVPLRQIRAPCKAPAAPVVEAPIPAAKASPDMLQPSMSGHVLELLQAALTVAPVAEVAAACKALGPSILATAGSHVGVKRNLALLLGKRPPHLSAMQDANVRAFKADSTSMPWSQVMALVKQLLRSCGAPGKLCDATYDAMDVCDCVDKQRQFCVTSVDAAIDAFEAGNKARVALVVERGLKRLSAV